MSMGVVVSPFLICSMVFASSWRNDGIPMLYPPMLMVVGSVWLSSMYCLTFLDAFIICVGVNEVAAGSDIMLHGLMVAVVGKVLVLL